MRVVLTPDRLGPRWLRAAVPAVMLAVLFFAGTGYDYRPADTSASEAVAGGRDWLASQVRLAPRGAYIVVDRANNRLFLRRGDATLLEAVCSAGSGTVLIDPEGRRRWEFDTPSGRFQVRSRTENPVWRKPDWAFVEEGQPVPTDPAERIEYGVLGEYALHLGDGYMIHGTLYERLLGRNVTHGCIRLGRDDLRTVYRASPVGTPVYIF